VQAASRTTTSRKGDTAPGRPARLGEDNITGLSTIQEYKRKANIQANSAFHGVKPPDYRIIHHSAVFGGSELEGRLSNQIAFALTWRAAWPKIIGPDDLSSATSEVAV
jgi:hypothetical protein